MTPLDLTKAPPRSPRAELYGLCMLPRMIDIARAMLPGGAVGDYQIGRGMSGAVFGAFGISAAQFVELVRGAVTDEDVAASLWSHRDVQAAALSRRLRSLTVGDVPEDLRTDFQHFYGGDHALDRSVFDILEADDTRILVKKQLTRRWSEPPPGAYSFPMIKTVSLEAALANGEQSLSLILLAVVSAQSFR